MTKKLKRIENLLVSAWAVSFIATIGSLYFSEIRGYIPCELCWVQRIFMYPFVILIAIAVVKKDAKQAYYFLPLSILGFLIGIYHYSLQKIPQFSAAGEACGIVPCNYQYINYFGFITIPFLSLTAYFILSIIFILIIREQKEKK